MQKSQSNNHSTNWMASKMQSLTLYILIWYLGGSDLCSANSVIYLVGSTGMIFEVQTFIFTEFLGEQDYFKRIFNFFRQKIYAFEPL